MASVFVPLAVVFAVSMALGRAAGRRAVLLPILLGAGFAVLLAVNGAGDTALGFLIVWLAAAVLIGVEGARIGARARDGHG